jgi:hypothetical protein
MPGTHSGPCSRRVSQSARRRCPAPASSISPTLRAFQLRLDRSLWVLLMGNIGSYVMKNITSGQRTHQVKKRRAAGTDWNSSSTGSVSTASDAGMKNAPSQGDLYLSSGTGMSSMPWRSPSTIMRAFPRSSTSVVAAGSRKSICLSSANAKAR